MDGGIIVWQTETLIPLKVLFNPDKYKNDVGVRAQILSGKWRVIHPVKSEFRNCIRDVLRRYRCCRA